MVHPGEFLMDRFLRPLGVSASELARAIGVPRSRVSEILSGRRGISVDTARRLGLYFGVEPTAFTERQVAWDLAHLPPVEIAPIVTEEFLVGPYGATPIPARRAPSAARTVRVGPALLARLRAMADVMPERAPRELVETTFENGQRAVESKPR